MRKYKKKEFRKALVCPTGDWVGTQENSTNIASDWNAKYDTEFSRGIVIKSYCPICGTLLAVTTDYRTKEK